MPTGTYRIAIVVRIYLEVKFRLVNVHLSDETCETTLVANGEFEFILHLCYQFAYYDVTAS